MKNTNGNINVEQRSSLRQGWFLLLVLLLAAVASVRVIFPRHVTPADAPVDKFSGERAMTHLPVIASQPHPQGSPAQAMVRDYLAEQLTGMGLDVEVQQANGIENVVAWLPGTDPTGAIVVLAHYDSVTGSPGAGDNGSGVSVLLEVMRALADGPAPRNTIIGLFDDGEELPDPFTGSRTFVQRSPWISDVRVAISLDTAVAGPIAINETGPGNGWLMPALVRSYNGGAWTSMSGGGNYDCTPFRIAGIQVIALESNYPFWQQHTSQDQLDIVQPASVQQMGDQTLAIARELGALDLTDLGGEQETFFEVLGLVFIHYPETWTIPLTFVAGILLVIAVYLALQNRLASLQGLTIAFGAILIIATLSAFGIGAFLPHLPKLFGWEISRWPEWPEVIPPYSGWINIAFALLILGMAAGCYLIARRWSTRVEFSLAGLMPFIFLSVATAFTAPRGAYLFTWPVLISSLGWIAVSILGKKRTHWSLDLALTLAAASMIVFILKFLPGIVMADGMKSLAILAGVEALILGVIYPAIDRLMVHPAALKKQAQ